MTAEAPRILSRQRRWQLKKQAEGKCTQCGSPQLIGSFNCLDCLIKRRIYNRAIRKHNPWRPGGPGRKPKETLIKRS